MERIEKKFKCLIYQTVVAKYKQTKNKNRTEGNGICTDGGPHLGWKEKAALQFSLQ